jgi:inorganic phosphate transporter, PiT family
MNLFDGSIGLDTLALLSLCLGIALGFEFVNGFHDTANAVATVIYTRSMKPWAAVVWSGLMNFLGVLLGGVAVAFSIVHLVAMSTIAAADLLGMPVSTTHVLSSGVAGAMAANQSGLQLKTVRAIATAWVLTLPVTMLLSGTLFSLTAGSSMKEIGKRAIVQPRPERVVPQLQ